MSSTSHPLVSALAAALHAMDAVTTEIAEYRGLSDEEFREAARLSTLLLRAAQVHGAVIAGELAHRSRPELGSAGLARREGFRTPEEMMRVTSGSTAREAAAAVRVGRLVHESAEGSGVDSTTGEVLASERAWLAEVGRAVAAGAVSIDGAESIERGLGKPSVHVSEQTLTELVGQLCAEAEMLDADRLYRRARELRDELDDLGLAEREAERRAQRSLTLYRRSSTGQRHPVAEVRASSAPKAKRSQNRSRSTPAQRRNLHPTCSRTCSPPGRTRIRVSFWARVRR